MVKTDRRNDFVGDWRGASGAAHLEGPRPP